MATVAPVDMLSKLAANLVKTIGSNGLQAKYSSSGNNDPCDLPSKFILHINKHARFNENGQSVLGYTDIAIYLVFN